jgi:hypothetical protein
MSYITMHLVLERVSEACDKYFWKKSLAAYRWIERK